MIIGRGNIQLQYRTQESRHDSFDMKAQHQLVSGRQLWFDTFVGQPVLTPFNQSGTEGCDSEKYPLNSIDIET